MSNFCMTHPLARTLPARRAAGRSIGMLGAATLLLCSSCTTHSGAAHSQAGSIPARPEQLPAQSIAFSLPKADRWTLPNGLVVFYKFDDELPKMSGKIYLPGGAVFDPAGKTGLSQIFGNQLRDGSVKGIAPDELDRQLDQLAAAIESSYGSEYGTVGFSCLTEDFGTVFDLFRRVVREPAFDPQRLALAKKLAAEGISRRKDDPSTVASATLGVLLYGAATEWGRLETIQSVAAIRRADLLRMWSRWMRPDGAILAASGSVPPAEFRRIVEEKFGDWRRRGDALPALPLVNNLPKPGIYVVERDFDQATILMGHLGPPRLPPDIYQMSLYNRVLSGGFGSVLFEEIRTHLGLAYDVSGGLAPGAVKGLFEIALGTRNEAALQALATTQSLVAKTLDDLPAQTKFDESKSAVERSFIFKFDDSGAVVQRAASQELLHYPVEFDSTYLEHVRAVSPEMVRAVAQKWVHPNEFVTVIVGRLKAEDVAAAVASAGIAVYRVKFETAPVVTGRVTAPVSGGTSRAAGL